jgi:hypothetical protein
MYLLSLFFISFSLLAAQVTGQITEIDKAKSEEEETLLFLSGGEVLKIDGKEDKLEFIEINRLETFQFEIDSNRHVKGIHILKNIKKELSHSYKARENLSMFVPTTLPNLNLAQKYHREGRRNQKDSQCFNRAMIWSFEWWQRYQLKSMKLFIFFSRNYIRKYNFEWWFHVAPYVHVLHEDKIQEKVMDLKYTSRPLNFRDWSNIFMKNNAECLVINNYSEYADYPYHGDCFLQRTHMFTYQPADLQMYESWGTEKFEFNLEEVKGAYLEAFDMIYE